MPGTLDQYKVYRTLGTGASCKVKLGEEIESGRKVAIKMMSDGLDEQTRQLVITEVAAMQKLEHEHVLKILHCGTGQYVKTNSKVRTVSYIVLEIAEAGEIFDFVATTGRFEENIARYFFKQILNGIDHCHLNGIAHRDLKPENLLLDNEYNIKIADFGYAGAVNGRKGNGYSYTKLGTLNYMAPEIILNQPYNAQSVDLFAIGVILFILVARHPPQSQAKTEDPFYKCLAANRADLFWKKHSMGKPGGEKFFSEEFKELIQIMLQFDPVHRPSLMEILSHPWTQGETASKEQVSEEFAKRHTIIKAQAEAEKQQKEKEKNNRQGPRDENHRGFGETEKELELFDAQIQQNTSFFSSWNPDQIEKELKTHLAQTLLVNPNVHDKKYKTKFTIQTEEVTWQADEHQDKDVVMNHENEICVRILKVDEDTVCVEFTNLSGPQLQYWNCFNAIKSEALNMVNDIAVSP